MPGGKATPRHVHPEADETFHVIGGEVLVHIGGNESKASTESTVVITRGVAHAFADTSGSMRVLVVFTPASPVSEAFFRAAGERATAAVLPLPAPPDIPWMTAAARKSGLQVLGPPPFGRPDGKGRALTRAPQGSWEEPVMKKPAPRAQSNAPRLITKYIDECGDWRTATLTRLREVILSAGPNVTEAWKWGAPAWEDNGFICVAGAFKRCVKLTFSKGASLRDPKRLFNASLEGKTWRAIDFHQGDKIDAAGIRALIREAAALNLSARRP